MPRTPEQQSPALVAGIRAASRDMVRELGFLGRTVAGTDLSPSAVHAILELGSAGTFSARDLAARLRLEKSTISRLVQALMRRGEVEEATLGSDRRVKTLRLTEAGTATLRAIDAYGNAQVNSALGHLDAETAAGVLAGLDAYATALCRAAGHARETGVAPVVISQGYDSGSPARIVQMITAHMAAGYGFGPAFEARVMRDMGAFLPRLERACNATWVAKLAGRTVGGITIDGEGLGENRAHLRWFVVDPGCRGQRVGKGLLDRALAFCDAAGFAEIHLWTVKGLDAARALYERNGFALAEEWSGDQWGHAVVEQKFVRRLPH